MHLSSSFRVRLVALCILLVAGCATAPDMPPTPAVQIATGAVEERSPGLHSGNHFHYWVWKEPDGSWHVRTTSARVEHKFQGQIRASLPNAIQSLNTVGLERGSRRHPGDRLEVIGSDIVFDFRTKNDIDGFDFQVVGAPSLEFYLRIDGDADPGKILLGKKEAKPESAHFIVYP